MAKIVYGKPGGGFEKLINCDKAYAMFGPLLHRHALRDAWDEIWKQFTCQNAECRVKEACDNRPTFVRIAAVLKPDKRYYFVVTVARRIRCKPKPVLKPGTDWKEPDDSVPEFPDPGNPWPQPKPPEELPEPSEPGKKPPAKPAEDDLESVRPRLSRQTQSRVRRAAARPRPQPRPRR